NMATASNNLKYRGNYRQYDSRGYEVAYTVGDVVVYNGKQYVSKTNNKKSIPTKVNTEWEILTANYKNFYYSARKNLPGVDQFVFADWLPVDKAKIKTGYPMVRK
ncbi:MAG: hypothetical protein EBU93_01965, partial [Chlamydiae bacterium]|nr:hypothetical protein [Chlamydiota bacterium]